MYKKRLFRDFSETFPRLFGWFVEAFVGFLLKSFYVALYWLGLGLGLESFWRVFGVSLFHLIDRHYVISIHFSHLRLPSFNYEAPRSHLN